MKMNWDDTAPVLTGNMEIDNLTGGWQPHDLILIYADDNKNINSCCRILAA